MIYNGSGFIVEYEDENVSAEDTAWSTLKVLY